MSDRVRVVFLHHSTGGQLIRIGRARERFHEAAPEIEFWDHGYDPMGLKGLLGIYALRDDPGVGLRDGGGRLQQVTWHIPGNNTNPDGLAALFQQPVTTPPRNAFSHLLAFDVIVFKSCFPVTAIRDEPQLEAYQRAYVTIRQRIDEYAQKLFIPMTPPPLRAELTTPEQAARARRFADWLQSDDFRDERGNIAVFDFFDALAERASDAEFGNTLQRRWCPHNPTDSHPSPQAYEHVVGQWVSFIIAAIQKAPFLQSHDVIKQGV